jgi:enoyl-CoA hydratase/carnithine racemase
VLRRKGLTIRKGKAIFKKIIFEKEEMVAVIRFNRPEVMNAYDMEMVEELIKAIDYVRDDDRTKVLIMTGTGKTFCVGVDITTIKGIRVDQGTEFLKRGHQILLNLVALKKPIIAAINGYAFGAGWNLALASDMIIASEDATFSQAFVKIGLVSDMGGMYFLPRFVSLNKAKELMFIGETIDAKEAERIGMVNRVVPKDDLERVARELAKKIALEPLKPIGLMKKILNQSAHLDLPSLLALEAEAQEICSQTDDHIKRIEAFLERRKKSLMKEKRRK